MVANFKFSASSCQFPVFLRFPNVPLFHHPPGGLPRRVDLRGRDNVGSAHQPARSRSKTELNGPLWWRGFGRQTTWQSRGATAREGGKLCLFDFEEAAEAKQEEEADHK